MQELERIAVRVRVDCHGRTLCLCMEGRSCPKAPLCSYDIVTRDRFRGWQAVMRRDRYGRSRGCE